MIFIKNNILFLACLDFTTVLFFLGLLGLLINRRNILLMLLSLELTFLASSLNFLFVSSFFQIITGNFYSILVILVVVADTAIGLSLVVLVYRGSKTASVNSLITLRG
jgi:NADH-quinone oxidoreductase subunit K